MTHLIAREVPIHVLKAGLSQYLKQASEGQSFVVTSHQRPVATLTGISATESAPGLKGLGDWSGSKLQFQAPVELVAEGRTLSDLVLAERR